jgi:hypothetical protein
MLHTRVQIFDVTRNFENFWELNMPSVYLLGRKESPPWSLEELDARWIVKCCKTVVSVVMCIIDLCAIFATLDRPTWPHPLHSDSDRLISPVETIACMNHHITCSIHFSRCSGRTNADRLVRFFWWSVWKPETLNGHDHLSLIRLVYTCMKFSLHRIFSNMDLAWHKYKHELL